MDFTAFVKTAGYFVAGAVNTEDQEEAFALVMEKVRSGLADAGQETRLEIALRGTDGMTARRVVTIGGKRRRSHSKRHASASGT